ncbi:8-amino-7-oxononanoate synthase [Bacillus solimangrovi]|uniref:8-amino-7-ketopelargonate synthase n=1 Tax=Bacillus solimangrovi TaxID=1305675 RepID=A0A1E5LJ41_9BACI|nr:8-amino-7-oxononanoate synthase [Bacillus solimangrovi]OEH94081.1 8-amino-7-oxononanoate synthase [Bacillus solimangrovi]
MNKYEWCKEEIELIKNQGLYREFKRIDSMPSTEVYVNGKTKTMASSNNYLGLANDPRLIQSAYDGMLAFGVGSSGSRLTSGNTVLHEKLEDKIAKFKNKDAALIYSSGYLANIGVISSLLKEGDIILSDELNHASIIDGCRLSKAKTKVYKHANMKDLEEQLKRSQSYNKKLIITDGVFSMDGTIAPLPEINKLAKQYGAIVAVDDAHATGVIGTSGAGTADYFETDVDITIGTFSKAIGTEGGYVVSSKEIIELLRNRSRSFIFQTAASPGVIAATIKSIEIIENDINTRKRLLDISKHLRLKLEGIGFEVKGTSIIPIIPVIIGQESLASKFAELIESEGVFAPAIRPPTVPDGESRIRLTVMATHTDEQIEFIYNTFCKVGKELGII